MRTDGIATRRYGRETLLALLVLALTFLNFGHVAIGTAGEVRITPDSWCGGPLAPGSADHTPCHACRIGQGADLPPPPAAIEPVVFAVRSIAYAPPMATLDLPVQGPPTQPRGPPAFV